MTASVPVLSLRSVAAGYGSMVVLRDFSVEVFDGEVVALLGANGAGKSTTLRVAAGMIRPSAGTVHVAGTDVTRLAPHARVQRGLCLIPEGRGVFKSLTVQENLRLHAAGLQTPSEEAYARALEAFPELADRLKETAGRLSGGQQQMLSLARAYVASPKVLLLDEVSVGLAPLVIDRVFEAVAQLAATGVGMLLVEQYVGRALGLADRVVLLNRGRTAYEGPAAGVDEKTLRRAYLDGGLIDSR